MEKSEIILGGTYSNGKGGIRKVIAEGDKCVLYRGVRDAVCIRYRVIRDGTKHNRTAGNEHSITRQSFSQWAEERIIEE